MLADVAPESLVIMDLDFELSVIAFDAVDIDALFEGVDGLP